MRIKQPLYFLSTATSNWPCFFVVWRLSSCSPLSLYPPPARSKKGAPSLTSEMGSRRRAMTASTCHGSTAQTAANGKESFAALVVWSRMSCLVLKASEAVSHHPSAISPGCCASICPAIHSKEVYQQNCCSPTVSLSWMSASTTYLVLCKSGGNPQILVFLSRY